MGNPDLSALVRQSTGLSPKDRLSIITDPELAASGLTLAEALRAQGFQPTLVVVPEPPYEGREPDPIVLEAIRASQVVIFATRINLLHSRRLTDALASTGVRALDMSGLAVSDVLRLLDLEAGALKNHLDELEEFIRSGRRLRLRGDSGTEFEFEIESQSRPNGIGPPNLKHLPLGQVRIFPRPGTGSGTVVADGVTLRFDKGRLVEASDPKLSQLLDRLDPSSRQFSLLTIGAHPSARRTGNPAEERLVYGQATLAIGSNHLYGGRVEASAHLPFSIARAQIEIDSKPLPEKQAGSPATPSPSTVQTPEMYRQLFSNSSEALYIVDFDSQVILEANPAFERLVGYSRDEIIGRLNSVQLVAPESQEIFAKRRAMRPTQPSDRYEIRIVARDKQVKPVEVSVRLIELGGRRVICGAMRDLTEQKRLQEAAWEKIEEIIKTNSRMGILKEKLEKMQDLTSQLFNLRDEKAILEISAEFMRDRSKLGYQNVNFYLLRGDALELALSTGRGRKTRIGLEDDNALVQVLHGEKPALLENERIVTPLKGIEQNIGVMEVFVPPKEMEALVGSPVTVRSYQNIAQALSNILGLSIENVRLYDKLLKQSILDPLTPTFNRRHLDVKLDEEFKRAQRYKRPLSVLMLDVNSFAKINNTMGHRQGDVVLQEIAQVLNGSTREVDVVARYGGDEFVIVMPETLGEGARAKAAALTEKIANTPYTSVADGTKTVRASCSIGAVGFDEEPGLKTPEELMRKADELMYAAKRRMKKAEGKEDTRHA